MRRINYALANKVLVIWLKPDNTYYWRVIKKNYNYSIGYRNGYNHEIILVVDIFKDFFYKEKFKNVVIKKLISFLHKLLRE